MKIQCLPRKWFEKIKGTVLEEQVLARDKVVSIQSRSGWDSEPPFSEEGLKSPNLLCLTFDDETDYSDLDEERSSGFVYGRCRSESGEALVGGTSTRIRICVHNRKTVAILIRWACGSFRVQGID